MTDEHICTVHCEQGQGHYPAPQKQDCPSHLNIRGEDFPCDLAAPHDGWAHGNSKAESIWSSQPARSSSPTDADQ